jgi:DNA repair exonuclease SbcCD ATPase subunit
MAALNGARGGVDIPEDDRQSVYNHLKRHYSDIDEDPPELKSKSEDGDKITLSKIATIVKQVIDETFGTERNKAMDKEKALEQIEKMREEFDDETLKSLGLSVEEEDSEEEESEEEEEESEEEDVDVEKSIQEALEPISEKLKSLPESYVEEEKVSDLEEKVKSLSEKMDTLKSALEDKEKEISELKSTVESLSPGSHDEEGERTKSTDGEDEDEDVEDDDVDSEDIDYETLWD